MSDAKPIYVTRDMKASYFVGADVERYEIDPPQELEGGRWYLPVVDKATGTARMVETQLPVVPAALGPLPFR